MTAPDDATLRRMACGDGSVSDDATYAPALAAEVLRLRDALAVQASAARMLGSTRDTLAARDRRTLDSLDAQDRADLLAEMDALRAECGAFNAEATSLREAIEVRVRDAVTAQRGAVCDARAKWRAAMRERGESASTPTAELAAYEVSHDLLATLERVATAPDKVAELLRQLRLVHDDIAESRALRVRIDEDHEEHKAELRAILTPRTTPPTPAEMAAHGAAGGVWLTAWPWRSGVWADDVVPAMRARDAVEPGMTWLPLDAQRRPCPWPVAAPAVPSAHGP
jgi:hypothetical protein